MDTMKLNKIAAAILLAGVVAMTTGFVTRLIHPAAGGGHHGAGDQNACNDAGDGVSQGQVHQVGGHGAGPGPGHGGGNGHEQDRSDIRW